MRDYLTFVNVINIVNLIAFALALWQLWLAKGQLRDARAQADEARAQTEHLKEMESALADQVEKAAEQMTWLDDIRNSLSTQYLGRFPGYLPKITEAILDAQTEIVILCDYPAYGCFSDHDNWHKYKAAVEQKADSDIKVGLTCPDKEIRSRTSREQFREAEQKWDEWKKNEKNSVRLRKLLGKVDLNEITWEMFMQEIEREDTKWLEELENKADITELKAFSPLHFWVADRKRAVFAISSYSDNVSNGFSTTDQRLVNAFYDIKERFHRDGLTTRAGGNVTPPRPDQT